MAGVVGVLRQLGDLAEPLLLRRMKWSKRGKPKCCPFRLSSICFLAQFGQSVVRADYLILRKGFIMNHNLAPTYDFQNYMIRSMEEEFEKIVGVRLRSTVCPQN